MPILLNECNRDISSVNCRMTLRRRCFKAEPIRLRCANGVSGHFNRGPCTEGSCQCTPIFDFCECIERRLAFFSFVVGAILRLVQRSCSRQAVTRVSVAKLFDGES